MTQENIERKFASRQHVVDFIKSHQCGLRNLTQEELAFIRGNETNAEKKPHGGDRRPKTHSEALTGKTAEHVASKHGVSRATFTRNATFAKAFDTIAANVGPEAK